MKFLLFFIALGLFVPFSIARAGDYCCLYLSGDGASGECFHISDDSEADCDEDANTIYPSNLVGAYESPDNSCFNVGGYTGYGIPKGPLCQYAMGVTEESGFKDDLNTVRAAYVKKQLEEVAKNKCCAPVTSMIKKGCFAPRVTEGLDERISSGFFDVSRLTPNSRIDGSINFWDFLVCAPSGADTDSWKKIDTSCSSYDAKSYCERMAAYYCLCDGKKTECKPSFFESEEDCKERLKAEWYDWQCIKVEDSIESCQDLTGAGPTETKEQTVKTLSIGDLKGQAKENLNPANLTSATQLIGRAIKLLIGFIGTIALALYIYSGLLWMTSAGNSGQVDKAKNILIWATLGVVVMLGSYVLVDFLFKSVR